MGGPEDVMLNEIRTSRKKPNLARCHSHEVLRTDEVAETQSRTAVSRDWQRGERGV